MDRNEVLRWLDRMWQHWYQCDERDGITDGPYTTALRAAAELIRAGGWQEIHEAPRDKTMLFAMHDHGRWIKLYVEKSVAVDLGCTHYLPEPEPPAREDSKS